VGSGQRIVNEDMVGICHIRRERAWQQRSHLVCDTLHVQIRHGIPDVEHLIALPGAVALSLVVSLDGQLCGPDGSSRSISGPEDLEWLRRLRASSDAVVVGASTAEAENYGPIRVRPEFAAARADAGMAGDPELVIVRSGDDALALLRSLGPRVLLEAGVRLHTAMADHIERVWLSHSPTIVGDHAAGFALPLDDFALVDRWCGDAFAISRFERVSRR
jgi:riboflavin biosynthesis pyrimidine reductase